VRYEVERAERQYNAVEPENRLVARTLEQRWEAALVAERKLREEHARFLERAPARLAAPDRDAIRCLADDIPALWRAETTTAVERKEIVRLLLERIEVAVDGNSERAEVVCHWAGGQQSRHPLVRPVRRTSQLSRHAELLDRIRALRDSGLRPPAIARTLVAEGWKTAHGSSFTEGSVRGLLTRMGVLPDKQCRPSAVAPRHEGEFTVTEIAARLNLPEGTVYNWIYQQRLPARRVPAAWHTLWLIRIEDVEALLRQRTAGGRLPAKQIS
jgi:excisionase family DNA binding protein